MRRQRAPPASQPPAAPPPPAARRPRSPAVVRPCPQIALAATAIAMIRARVMVDLYFGYYCAFQLDDRQMCTPTIGVASTSLVLSALVAFLSLVRTAM